MKIARTHDAVAIIYYRKDGRLYHWTIGAHATQDTIDSLKRHLDKWIPGAEFVDGRIEKPNPANRDTADYHERLRWALFLTRDAVRIETSDGHLMTFHDGAWYAFPFKGERRDHNTAGGDVIRENPNTVSSPKKFDSAIDAYQACLEAVGYFEELAKAEQQLKEVAECSAAS